MRSGLLVSALLLASDAFADDARVSFLKKQLVGAKDPRLRAQTCALLGRTGSADAVAPLCGALKDPEAVVRSAAAGALGEFKQADAISCLKAALSDADATVRRTIERALEPPAAVTRGGLYIAIDPVADRVGTLAPEVVSMAYELLKAKVQAMGAAVAPVGETKSQASALITKNSLKGYLMRANLLPNGATGLKLEVLVMTYPDQALQGTWNVKATGAQHEKLLKAMVPRVVDDAAADLDWK